jgi:hypothetical protein
MEEKQSLKQIVVGFNLLNEQNTTSGEFDVEVPVQDVDTKVKIKYGFATGPLDDVTISWGDESHNVDFEFEETVDDAKAYDEFDIDNYVAYSEDDKWRFIVPVKVEPREFSGDGGTIIKDESAVEWDDMEIAVDDSKVNEQEDPRRPKDIEFDTAQAMSKLTPDDREKVGDIQSMMSKEKYLSPKGGPLEELTFDMVVSIFVDNYKDIQFTRKQPNGEDGPYYRDSITFPNTDDTSTSIGDMSAFEDWKNKTIKRFGNVSIKLDPKSDMWFDKVKVIDDEFQTLKDKFAQGKADAMKRDQELGRSIDENFVKKQLQIRAGIIK